MSVYDIITEKVLEQLAKGEVPWRKPWSSSGIKPQNFVSRKPYRGINAFLLNCLGYDQPFFVTYNQAKELGGHVKKGEKANMVVFYKLWEKEDREDPEKTNRIPLLRYYNVFHLSQCEGIDLPPKPEEKTFSVNPIATAEEIVTHWTGRPPISFGGDRAFYRPSEDRIQVPNRDAFQEQAEFYSTLFHELTHSTGHPNRLDRKGISDPSFFGSHEYSKEELVAEMGAAFLCGEAGILNKTLENSAAYLDNWRRVLKADTKAVVQAAAQAQKAADLILGRQAETLAEAA